MYVLQEKAEALVYGYTSAAVKFVQYKTVWTEFWDVSPSFQYYYHIGPLFGQQECNCIEK